MCIGCHFSTNSTITYMWKYMRSAMKPFGYLILFNFGFFLCIVTSPCLGAKVIRTSAKSLAERTGAAQYAVHIEEELAPEEISSPHDLRKRLSNENLFDDSDYEIYQGVVGRPGIDFPVLTSIPQTTFNCRDFGNGYFADLETECQVFHICEGGKKISFLCPNGTIFQQTELICDWWFKVNCAASPGHYAESSEVLSRAQNRSSQHSTNKPKPIVKLDKSSSQQKPSEEISSDAYDFEDISFPDLNAPKSNALNVDRKAKAYSQRSQNLQNAQSLQNGRQNSQESQVFAASSSFVNPQANNFNGYYYKQPNEKKPSNQKEATTQSPQPQATSSVPVTTSADVTFVKNNNFDGYQYNDPDRSSRRFQNAKLTTTTTTTTERNNQAAFSTTTLAPITYPNRGTTKYKDTKETNEFIINVVDTAARTTPPPLIRGRVNGESTTARYEAPRTTPYYTPTVPSVSPARPGARNRLQETRPTVSSAKVAEHAMEMMQTIHDLKLDNPSESNENDNQNRKVKDYGSRSGLVIPPSSGPETIHSLALYFATAVDSLVTKPMAETTTVLPIPGLKGLDVHAGNVTKLESSLVSDTTKRQYETLFGIDEDDKLVDKANIRDGSNDDSNASNNDLETEFSNNPVIAASGTKQIRELAQVFTHALSAYLHDPSTFRRVLAEIRPTEPPPVQSTEYLTNRLGRNKDFKDGTGATYLPTSATPSVRDVNGAIPTTEDLEVLDFSDVTLSTPFSKEQSTDIINNSESSTPLPAVDIFDTTRSQILHESLKQVDHIPASRILTEALESYALNQYTGNSLDGTTEPSNPLAIEINGGLEATTTYPYFEDFENQNNTFQFPSRLTDTDYPAQTTDYPNIVTTSSGPLSFDLLPPSSSGNKGFEFPKSEITAPVDENDLQRAQSQSIYGNGKNTLEPHRTGKEYTSENDIKSLKNENGHYITELPTVTPAPEFSKTTYPDNGKINPNTWSTLSYSVFLDPLTINDGLMSSGEQSTQVPNSSSSSAQTTQTPNFESTEPTISPYFNNENRQGKAVSPTNGPPTHEDYLHVMQRKANEMFGSLNDTSADHLMNVMKKADKNKTVRKLILLLIQTCDDDYNKTVEQSRQALLTALIGMDGKTDDGNEIQTIHAKPYREEKSLNLNSQSSHNAIPTTTTQLPITTYHRPLSSRITVANYATHVTSTPQNAALNTETTTFSPLFQSTNYYTDTTATPNYDYTTTAIYSTDIDTTTTTYYQPPTTTFAPTTTTTTRAPTTIKSRRRTTPAPIRNSKRLAKDLDQYLAHQGDTNYSVNQAHRNSDARALELLRSLYSLAGRFGK
ncbi:mucin-5AC isoform X2 [Contarinia nasturtii]|uniref:mucin-5AC isoform X2 n=1 Tax=Contarinia nasturtii TaxID=265458 RepID=UPI0012D3FE24|nr:mucin-5AC isoform X2 [Contarinia nasturtii]